jgi:predicted ferric reductase
MWAVFASAFLVVLRRCLRLRLHTWRVVHKALAAVIVVGSVVHALLIQGTMEAVTKAALSALILVATVKVVVDLRGWASRLR